MRGKPDAVVLAAGLSSRMDLFKPLAPLGGRTVLERVVTMLLAAKVRRVVVVTGHRAEEVGPRAEQAGARPVHNTGYQEGMFTSIRTGVAALAADSQGFLLLPVDIPLVRASTVSRQIDAFAPDLADIIHPTFRGRRGHPPLLTAELYPVILDAGGNGGLRPVLASFETEHPDRVLEIPVADQGVLEDMDTEEDFQRLAGRWVTRHLPTPEECRALMDLAGTPERARLHGRAVARVAVALGRAVNGQRSKSAMLDLECIERAALVHDLAKGHPHHEQEGGRQLREAGFESVAGIVAAHRDMDPEPGAPVTEQEAVFVADKVVSGTTLVPIKRRYEMVLERHGRDPKTRRAILARMERALMVQSRVEEIMGSSLREVAASALKDV